jgi:hypothetical protein
LDIFWSGRDNLLVYNKRIAFVFSLSFFSFFITFFLLYLIMYLYLSLNLSLAVAEKAGQQGFDWSMG